MFLAKEICQPDPEVSGGGLSGGGTRLNIVGDVLVAFGGSFE